MNATPSRIDVSTLREGETKAAHTAGPWVRVDTPDYAEIHPATRKGPSAIALVGKPEDANLIAAAPDLLAALQAMDAYWSEDIPGPDSIQAKRFEEGGLDLWRQMRAAIAKAVAP